MEELDEFGIPVKKTTSKVQLDDFGIPIKKKVDSTSTTPPQKLVSETKVGSSDGVKFPKFDINKYNKKPIIKQEVNNIVRDNINVVPKANKQTSIKVVQKQNEDYKIVQKKEEERDKMGFGGASLNRLDTGFASVSKSIYDTPKMLLDAIYAPQNYIADKFNIPILRVDEKEYEFNNVPSKMMDDIIVKNNNNVKEYKESIGGDIVTTFNKGQYGNTFKHSVLNSLESAPLIAVAMATGGESLVANSIMATSSASTQYNALSKEYPEMDINSKLLNATVSGALEVVVGKYIEGVSGNVWKQVLKEKGKNETIKIATNSFKKTLEKVIGKNPVVGVASEYAEERITDGLQQLNDMSSGIRTDFDWDQNKGAGLSSIGFSLPNATALYSSKAYISNDTRLKVKNANKEAISLQKQLENPEISLENSEIIKKTISNIYDKTKVLLNSSIEKLQYIPETAKKELLDIDDKIDQIEDNALNIKHGNEFTAETKKVLLANLKLDFIKAKDRKDNILNNTKNPFEALPDIEKIKIKDIAGRELMTEQNPDGTKNIKIDNEQITERANIIYLNQLKDAETKSTITNEAQPETEIQEQTITKQEQKVIESAQEGNTSADGNVRPTDNADLQQQEIEAVQPATNVGEGKSDVEYAREQIDSSILNWDGNIFSPRIDLGMTWADIRKGQADLAKGKENTVPAKRLVEAINKAKEEGGYRYKFGTGSENSRATEFVTFEDMQKTKNEYNLTDLEQKEVIDNEVEYSKQYAEYFDSLNEQTQNEILDINENKSTEVSGNSTSGKSEINVSSKEASKRSINEGNTRESKVIEIQKLEQERDTETINASKPIINESDYRVTGDDIKKAKIAPTREEMTSYKENYKALKNLKALINCL